jgi:type IX secretion system PorP/SprF family membrane protein
MRKKIQNSRFKSQKSFGGIAAGVCLACLPMLSYGQADIHFSQFYETSILRNPALTGVFADDYKIGVYYRNQWESISNPFNTVLATAETHFQISQTSEDFVSVGLLGYSDKAGSIDQRITAFYPALNYNKSLNSDHNTFLSAGFTTGYVQYSFDPSKATFNNQYVNGKFDPANPSLENLPNATMSMYDLGAGLNFNTGKSEPNSTTFVLGASVYHVTQPKFSYYQKPGITENMRFNINGGLARSVTDQVTLQFQANYASEGTYTELIFGGLVNWTQSTLGIQDIFILSGGVFYRYQDAIIPVVKVNYKHIAIGVSYDVNVSTLKEASNMQGGTEITLFYTGNYSDKGVAKKTVCPKF